MSGGRERWKIMIRRARKPLRAEGWTVTEAVAKLGCTRQTFMALLHEDPLRVGWFGPYCS